MILESFTDLRLLSLPLTALLGVAAIGIWSLFAVPAREAQAEEPAAAPTSTPEHARPPIDGEVHSRVETATFALG